MSKLYIVPTPIGNLEDITFRAVRVLKEVNYILAEDKRQSAKLLKYYEIGTAMQPYHKFNEHKNVEKITQRIQAGETMALITDAGTPAISDPGYLIVKHCVENNIKVECLPGATAFVPALVNSALPNDKFCFEGFLPQKKGRQKRLKELADEKRTMVFYESPYRILKALNEFVTYFGKERQVTISREISKIYEETLRGTAARLYEQLKDTTVKGELVVCVEGKKTENKLKNNDKV